MFTLFWKSEVQKTRMKIRKYFKIVSYRKMGKSTYRNLFYKIRKCSHVPHLGVDMEVLETDCTTGCAVGFATSCTTAKFEWILEWTSGWSGLIPLGIDADSPTPTGRGEGRGERGCANSAEEKVCARPSLRKSTGIMWPKFFRNFLGSQKCRKRIFSELREKFKKF